MKAIRLVGFLAAFGLVAFAACSDQGQGERCDVRNGDVDCRASEDLACYPANQLTNSESDRCCPRDRTKATAPVCLTPVATVGGDGGAPADTGPPAVTPNPVPEASTTNDASSPGDAASTDQ